MNKRFVNCLALIIALLFAPGVSSARWMNPNTGRFWTMDAFDGGQEDPISLHKYLYCSGNPVNRFDPNGHDDLISFSIASSMSAGLESLYNAGVVITGNALQATILGVEAGMSEEDILLNYYKDVGEGLLTGFALGKSMALLDDVLSTGEINLGSVSGDGQAAADEISLTTQENDYLNVSKFDQSDEFIGPQTGGRLGNAGTRQQIEQLVGKLEKAGWDVKGYGGFNGPGEIYVPPINGGRTGGSYADITAMKNGKTLRVNTVDTDGAGLPTKREAENAARIKLQKPKDTLILIPKWK